MGYTPDHPLTRADLTCPNCLEAKGSGLVLCWQCHHSQKRFNDGCYSRKCEAKIDAHEATLKARGFTCS